MILIDEDIEAASVIAPFDDKQLNPASYDLVLNEDVVVAPHQFRLSHTTEVVSIGAAQGLIGFVCGKSSWAREGLIVEAAGLIDPGFTGQIVLELFNMSDADLHIEKGRRVCQVYFQSLTGVPLRSYEDHGHYQGQRGNVGPWWR